MYKDRGIPKGLFYTRDEQIEVLINALPRNKRLRPISCGEQTKELVALLRSKLTNLWNEGDPKFYDGGIEEEASTKRIILVDGDQYPRLTITFVNKPSTSERVRYFYCADEGKPPFAPTIIKGGYSFHTGGDPLRKALRLGMLHMAEQLHYNFIHPNSWEFTNLKIMLSAYMMEYENIGAELECTRRIAVDVSPSSCSTLSTSRPETKRLRGMEGEEEGTSSDSATTSFKFFNATPHDLHIYPDGDLEKTPITIPKSGIAPRMTSTEQVKVEVVDGIPVYTAAEFTGIDITDFKQCGPHVERCATHLCAHVPPHRGMIVARYVAQHMKTTGFEWPGGIYSVDAGPASAVRSTEGKLMGVQRLEVWIPSSC